jgi:hypothetical protein
MPISPCSAVPPAGKKGAVNLTADLLPLTYPNCAACCGIWSGASRLITTPRAPGHAGAADTSSEPSKVTGNNEPRLKPGCSTRRGRQALSSHPATRPRPPRQAANLTVLPEHGSGSVRPYPRSMQQGEDEQISAAISHIAAHCPDRLRHRRRTCKVNSIGVRANKMPMR